MGFLGSKAMPSARLLFPSRFGCCEAGADRLIRHFSFHNPGHSHVLSRGLHKNAADKISEERWQATTGLSRVQDIDNVGLSWISDPTHTSHWQVVGIEHNPPGLGTVSRPDAEVLGANSEKGEEAAWQEGVEGQNLWAIWHCRATARAVETQGVSACESNSRFIWVVSMDTLDAWTSTNDPELLQYTRTYGPLPTHQDEPDPEARSEALRARVRQAAARRASANAK